MAAIETQALSKRWPDGRRALADLSLAVEPGEAVALHGANGAGKSTLFHVLVGWVRPTSGTARLLGVDVREARARAPVGFVPERPAWPRRAPVTEVLERLGALSGLDDAPRRVPPMLARLGLSDRAEDPVEHLSKGLRQRLAVAQALLHEPRILLLDEPLDGLDAESRTVIDAVLRERHASGTTVLISSHLPDALAWCDRAVHLVDGRAEAA